MFYLLFGALCITTAPLLVKYINLGASFVGLVRCLSGGIFLSWGLVRDRSILWSQIRDFQVFKWLLLGGFIFFADLFVWHNSITMIGAGKATVLGNTQVFYLSIFGLIFFKEKVRPIQVVGAISAMGGIALMIWGENEISKSENYALGIVYGLLTGLFYSIYVLSLSKLSRPNKEKNRSLSNASNLSLVCFVACLFLLPSSIIEGSFHLPSARELIALLALGFVAQFLGWLSIKKGLSTIPVAIGGIVLLLQPVLATLMSVALFKESLGRTEILGLILAIVGIGLGTMKRK